MSKIIGFGEKVEGYEIPVLNEREIRAAAGIFFLSVFISFMLIVFKGDFVFIKYNITVFLFDFIIRVFINPKFAPSLIIGRLIVGNQTPEYVGAKQKKFAWSIGIAMAATMFVLMVLVNSYSPISGIICLMCMIFLFFESVFGICLACKVYPLFFKDKVQYCPGEVCDVKSKQEIQKVSKMQLLMVVGLIGFVFLTHFLFQKEISEKPFDLFGIEGNIDKK